MILTLGQRSRSLPIEKQLQNFRMFATPTATSQTQSASGGTRRSLFSTSSVTTSHRRFSVDEFLEEEEPDLEPPVPEAGGCETRAPTTSTESSEMLNILRNLQQQVSALQAQGPTVASSVSPAASTSSSTNSSPTERNYQNN